MNIIIIIVIINHRVYDEALIGSLVFKTENPTKQTYANFEELYRKKSTRLSFGRVHQTSFHNNDVDDILNCRFRFFFRMAAQQMLKRKKS